MRPLMLMDFDGVINFAGSSSAYRKHEDTLGHTRRAQLTCNGVTYMVRWSAELVLALNRVKREAGAEWRWLSTWRECAVTEIDPEVGTQSDGAIAWDPLGELLPGPSSGSDRDIAAARKYEQVLKVIANSPRPFVWIDDDATVKYQRRDFAGALDVPHLIVAPDERYGMVRGDLRRVVEFLRTVANSAAC